MMLCLFSNSSMLFDDDIGDYEAHAILVTKTMALYVRDDTVDDCQRMTAFFFLQESCCTYDDDTADDDQIMTPFLISEIMLYDDDMAR